MFDKFCTFFPMIEIRGQENTWWEIALLPCASSTAIRCSHPNERGRQPCSVSPTFHSHKALSWSWLQATIPSPIPPLQPCLTFPALAPIHGFHQRKVSMVVSGTIPRKFDDRKEKNLGRMTPFHPCAIPLSAPSPTAKGKWAEKSQSTMSHTPCPL